MKLLDDIAERLQLLGGVSIAMAADVVEITRVSRPPRGREAAPGQLARLLAHEIVIREVGKQQGPWPTTGTTARTIFS